MIPRITKYSILEIFIEFLSVNGTWIELVTFSQWSYRSTVRSVENWFVSRTENKRTDCIRDSKNKNLNCFQLLGWEDRKSLPSAVFGFGLSVGFLRHLISTMASKAISHCFMSLPGLLQVALWSRFGWGEWSDPPRTQIRSRTMKTNIANRSKCLASSILFRDPSHETNNQSVRLGLPKLPWNNDW
jgi:hypothetical protein